MTVQASPRPGERAGSGPPCQQRAADLPTVRFLARGDWRLRAACQSVDPDLFFPISASGRSLEQVTAAKAICAACPVRRECLAFALITGQAHGVWGGLTQEERQQAAGVGERGAVARSDSTRPPRAGEVRIA
jgi:WhiB family redox-sensing transcriptional regulator